MVSAGGIVPAGVQTIAVIGACPLKVDVGVTAVEVLVYGSITVVIDLVADLIVVLFGYTGIGDRSVHAGQATYSGTGTQATVGVHRYKVFVALTIAVVVYAITEVTLLGVTGYTAVLDLSVYTTGSSLSGTNTLTTLGILSLESIIDDTITVIILSVADIVVGGETRLAIIDDGAIGTDLLADGLT